VKGCPVFQNPQIDFLNQVFARAPRAGQTEEEIEDLDMVSFEENGQFFDVAVSHFLHQGVVCHGFHVVLSFSFVSVIKTVLPEKGYMKCGKKPRANQGQTKASEILIGPDSSLPENPTPPSTIRFRRRGSVACAYFFDPLLLS
jgi:hypothetical protein